MQAPLQQQGGDPWRGMFLDTYSSFFFYLQSIFFFFNWEACISEQAFFKVVIKVKIKHSWTYVAQ